jgi:hypothetical protein
MATISNITKKGLTAVSANLDGISFGNIIRSGYNSGSPYIEANTPWQKLDETAPMQYSVNAVDILWNEAVLPNSDLTTGGSKTIYTTGDLLKLIDDMQQEIYTLAAAVIAIGNR